MLSLRPPAAPAAPAPAAPAYGFAAPITAPAAGPHTEEEEATAAPPQQGGLLRKLLPQRRASADAAAPKYESPQGVQRWRRIDLAPGIELHIREPAAPALHERIDRLIGLAHELFEIRE
jgi:hypothetical protein